MASGFGAIGCPLDDQPKLDGSAAADVRVVAAVPPSAVSTAPYGAFLFPAPSNSRVPPLRQESLSRIPHALMPVRRATLMHALTVSAYAVAGACAMSGSVICTSTPSVFVYRD
ncbi:hypothetical protein GCM10010345_19350 [Streptomyces canarius]|uniref:Uncharacterized protein n=1 Tax=Streptomyces canarius TaxID=285453 RepID=A0ABQ3CIB5_9ACTN|nr:hypothetical protein GCM10010345_19350 [Streptomyces canarius]